MDSLTILYIIGSIASIIGVVFGLVAYIFKKTREFIQKKQQAELEFNQEMELLEATGGTVSARTDLGFFITLELNSFYDYSNELRYKTIFFLLGSILLISFTIPAAILPSPAKGFVRFGFVASLICCGLGAYCDYLRFQTIKYTRSYKRRIKEVWMRPINKRMANDVEGKAK